MTDATIAPSVLAEQVERLTRERPFLRDRRDLPRWAIFTEDGTPRWFGPEPVDQAEPLDLAAFAEAFGFAPESNTALMIQLLATHRRLPDGTWVLRGAPAQVEPTEAERAAAREEEARAAAEAEAERRRAVEQEVFRRSGPDQLLRIGGKITIAEFNARLAVIRAAVEAGV